MVAHPFFKLLNTSSTSGASVNISSVIPVNSMIVADNGWCGFAKDSKRSIISPPFTFTAANSITVSYTADKPVVSTSKTTYVSLQVNDALRYTLLVHRHSLSLLPHHI